MHVPDGYLSPSTCAVLYGASTPFLYVATRQVRRLVAARLVPLLSIFAAFSFVIMMFNIPLPGGTSGHAVGATLATVVLGPWGAMLVVTVALTIQALFFGDGGILALGANVFNMAIAMPLVAYPIYRAIAGRSDSSQPRIAGAAVAGYVSMNVAALLTALEFGIQPALFRAADGAPLYAPYGLEVAIPAMMIGHLLVAGPAEAIVTALAVGYLLRTNPDLLRAPVSTQPARASVLRLKWLWAGIAALVVLVPVGLLTTATAWGEWNPTDPEDWPLPFVPQGLQELSGLWAAPLPDYVLPFLGEGASAQVVGYVGSAAVGVLLLLILGLIVGRLAARSPESRAGTYGEDRVAS